MAGKKAAKKRTTTAKTETFRVPRSAVALAEAIRYRMKTSPGYWQQLQTAMASAEAGVPFRATQAEPRTQH